MSLALLFLQLSLVLVTARLCGLALRAVGQPMVIGEMAAGVLLGPVVFGALFPQWHQQLFPPASLPALAALANVGVVLFMFMVGAELRAPTGMGSPLRAAGWVAISSMVLPMVLGLAIAPVLYPALAPRLPRWIGPPHRRQPHGAAGLGAAMRRSVGLRPAHPLALGPRECPGLRLCPSHIP